MKKNLMIIVLIIGFAIFLVGCSNKENVSINGSNYPFTIIDSTGSQITIKKEPKKVVSFSPVVTEIIAAIGKENILVGRTSFCDYPQSVEPIPIMGDLTTHNMELIAEAEPDIVLASAFVDEAIKEQLKQLGIPLVVIYSSGSFNDVYNDIKIIAKILNEKDKSEKVIEEMKNKVSSVKTKVKESKNKPSIYYVLGFIKGNFTATGKTFIDEMITMAALFAGDLFRMYSRFAENKNWKIDILNSHENDVGGYKEIIFSIEGQGAYSQLKYESGVHRVQRIPTTESGGRIHTSTVTVAVLPEAEEVDVNINPNDVRVDLFCSSGPGGQSVNTTQSAVRLTHVPSGIVVSCQDEKSQHKNKDKAMKILMARLYEKLTKEEATKIANERKSQVGTGDRSERIRTYNFPQNRITDHCVGLTIYRLDSVLEGDLEEIINALITTNQAERLKESV